MVLAALAPAKVNLVLDVGRLRPDGFHDVRSLLVPLDLADRVRVSVRPARSTAVSCRCPGRPDLDGPSNLGARAAHLFLETFGLAARVGIRIEKRVPVTAGLGGGSSDAAAVLKCLARAFRVRDRPALARVGLGVGSDVPFFLGSGPAWVAGRGERLRPARVGRLHLVLVHPRDPTLAIRASDAYRWLDESRAGRPSGAEAWPPGARIGAHARNDLQGPAAQRHPTIAELRARLEGLGASAAIMSGSGPTVFGVFAGRASARRAAMSIGADSGELDVFVVETLQRQPGVTPWRSPRSVSSRSTRRS